MDKQTSPSATKEEEQNLRWFSGSFIVSQVFGVLAVILIFVWMSHYRGGFAWTSDPQREFNYHPVLMCTGMVYFYGNAIMVYRVFRNEKKKKTKLCHAFLHALAFIMAVVALVAVFDSHNLAKKGPIPNLYSLHSWIGLPTVILFGCQFVAGFVSFLYPGIRIHLRIMFMPAHVFFGMVIFVLVILSAVTGVMEKAIFSLRDDYSKLTSEGILANCFGITVVLFALTVVYIVINPGYKRQPLPEEEMPLVGPHEH